MLPRWTLALMIPGALAGCAGVPTVRELPATVTIGVGEEFRIAAPQSRVWLTDIVQDSRCPVNADCIQAGSATLRLVIGFPDRSTGTLLLETDKPPVTVVPGLRFWLVSLEPLRRAGVPIEAHQYRATVEISSQ